MAEAESLVAATKDKFVYAVIEFKLKKMTYVSACPLDWITGNSCMWSSKTGCERKAISNIIKPESDWLHIKDIAILGKYCTYKEALYNEKKKSVTSDESDVDVCKRKVKKNKKYRDDSVSPPPVIDEFDERSSHYSSSLPSSSDEDISAKKKKQHEKTKRVGNSKCSNSIESHDRPTLDGNLQECKIPEMIPELSIQQQHYSLSESEDIAAGNKEEDPLDVIPADNTLLFDGYVDNSNVLHGDKNLDDIWNCLQGMKEHLILISDRLDNLEKMIAAPGGLTMRQTGIKLPKLPLQSIVELQDLEEDLKNKELDECLFNYLQFIGGNDSRLCVFRVCEKIFTNYLAQFCSWTGKGGNFQISNLKLMDILKRAVKISYPALTEQQFENTIMAWFNHGKTRHSRDLLRNSRVI